MLDVRDLSVSYAHVGCIGLTVYCVIDCSVLDYHFLPPV